ncbi:MAG: hypothetical protein REI11_06335, partial [Patulibacter sp.]|nr:hypothetical protein [Patulibacter sp.]
HVVRSTSGSATILVTADGRVTCLSLPDPEIPDSPGGSCAPTARIEANGFLGEMVGVKRARTPNPHSSIAYILPIGASNPRLYDGVDSHPVTVVSGVVLASIDRPSQLRYGFHGATRTVPLSGPFMTEDLETCHGETRRVTIEPGSDAGGAPGHLAASDLCDDAG